MSWRTISSSRSQKCKVCASPADQVVDSVNFAVQDPRPKSRDAVIVGGSDEEGVLAALARLREILGDGFKDVAASKEVGLQRAP